MLPRMVGERCLFTYDGRTSIVRFYFSEERSRREMA